MDTQNVTLDEVRTWPATVSVRRACDAIGISGTHGYTLARRGEFPCRVIRPGGRVRVVTASLIALLEGAGSDDEGEVRTMGKQAEQKPPSKVPSKPKSTPCTPPIKGGDVD